MNPKPCQLVLAACVCGLVFWAGVAQAGFIRAQDALAQAASDSALARLELPELASAGASATPATPAPLPQPQDEDTRPLVRPNYLRPIDGHQAGMTSPSASSAGGTSSGQSIAILPAGVEPPCAGLSARLPTDMGISFSPPPPWTPLRPPCGRMIGPEV